MTKTALITGSTSGIGYGLAMAFAKAGYSVIMNGYRDAPDAVAGITATASAAVHFIKADLSQPDQATGLVTQALERCGRIDVLINNAGIQHTDAIEDFPPAQWDAVLALNLSAAFHTMRAVVPHMRARGSGRLINIASAHGLVASPHKAAYVAAKHGLVGLTKVVALELADCNDITANTLCPGWVLTPLVEKQIAAMAEENGIGPDQARQQLLTEKQPKIRFATPEEIGALAVFLASDAGGSITGSAYSIDNGWTAQ